VQCVDANGNSLAGSCFCRDIYRRRSPMLYDRSNMLANISSITGQFGDQLLLEFGGLLHQRAGLLNSIGLPKN